MNFKFSLAVVWFNLFVDPALVSSETEPSWKDCPTIEHKRLIDCRNFGLTKIPLDIYDSSWQNIRLSKNPFICDCTMNTFLHNERFSEYLRRTKDLRSARCAEPAAYAGVRILKLHENPTFCKNDKKENEEGNGFWSFLSINPRFIAAIVLVSLLLILAFITCLKRCKKDNYSYHRGLLLSHSIRNKTRTPFALSKWFGRASKNDLITLNEAGELTDDDDIVYENIR